MSAAFPTLIKPAAKQRRRSLSGACPAWPSRATDAADAADEATAAAAGVAAEEGGAAGAGTQAAGGSSLLNYWSDPLPLPGMAAQLAAVVAAADEDMQDTAASPASSSGAGGVSCSSPVCGTDAGCACGSPMLQPALSPLRESAPRVQRMPLATPRLDSSVPGRPLPGRCFIVRLQLSCHACCLLHAHALPAPNSLPFSGPALPRAAHC